MLHRILDKGDKRYVSADPHYMIDCDVFEKILHFFSKHYSIVSLSDVIAFSRGDIKSLPPRPLLITFDDGWRDNYDYAMPLLQAYHMPAVLFMVSSVFGRMEPFWQEKLIGLYQAGKLSIDDFNALRVGLGLGPIKGETLLESDVRGFISTLFHQNPVNGDQVVDFLYQKFPEETRQFVTIDELKEMMINDFEVGFHGQTHTPLPAADFESEIKGGWADLEKVLVRLNIVQNYKVMSFPHGQYNSKIEKLCTTEGFDHCFTSVEENIDLSKPLPFLLGRICIDQEIMINDVGAYTPEKLLIWLMR